MDFLGQDAHDYVWSACPNSLRQVGTGIAAVGTPFGVWVLHPVLGEAFAIIEMVVVLTIIGTALFGSSILSERAFRLLGLEHRLEPPEPPGDHLGIDGKLPMSARCRAP